jgi:tRNA nucleotidyltransferase (CCA-adding enzyme)
MMDVGKKENVSNTNNDKICLSLSEYNNLITTNKTTLEKSDIVEIRDRKVVSDQLYPPLNRTDNNTHEELVKNINNRGMYIRTNDINDKYRLVAYVTNSSEERDAGNNNWKLFARQKDRNISDFYMKPTDNNNDMKVPITDDIVIGDRLRDIYNIPKQLTFNSPLFNKNPYNVVEIPKADLSNSGDYI